MMAQVQTLRVWRRTGRLLQLSHAKGNADHAPLVMDFMTRSWHEPKSDSNCTWDYDRYMQAWLKGGPHI
eukprot:5415291-Pyramimonas_sp.AAC.1